MSNFCLFCTVLIWHCLNHIQLYHHFLQYKHILYTSNICQRFFFVINFVYISYKTATWKIDHFYTCPKNKVSVRFGNWTVRCMISTIEHYWTLPMDDVVNWWLSGWLCYFSSIIQRIMCMIRVVLRITAVFTIVTHILPKMVENIISCHNTWQSTPQSNNSFQMLFSF